MRRFLKEFETTLAVKPVAVFFLSTYVKNSPGLVLPDAKSFFAGRSFAQTPQITVAGNRGMSGGKFTFVELGASEFSGYGGRDPPNAAVVTARAEYISTFLALSQQMLP